MSEKAKVFVCDECWKDINPKSYIACDVPGCGKQICDGCTSKGHALYEDVCGTCMEGMSAGEGP